MNRRVERAIEVGQAVLQEARAEKLTFMAGSIAYHAFVSLLPLLALVLVVISNVGNESLRQAFITFISTALTPNAGGIVVTQLEAADTAASVSALGVIVLVWGTLRIFRGLDTAFSDIYETESANTLVDQLTDGVVVLATFALALIAGWAVNAVLSGVGPGPLARTVRPLVLIAGLAVTFFPMYYLFPDADVSAREVVPGVLVVAVGLAVFESLFRFYTEFKSPGTSVVAGVLVLLTWLYFSGLVVLLGAAINAVLSNRSEDVDIDPVFGVPADNGRRRRASADRAELIASLRAVEASLDGADELSITVDGTETRLLSPGRVTADAGDSTLPLDDGTVSLELRWTPRDVTDE